MTEEKHIVNKNESREAQAKGFESLIILQMNILNPQNKYFKKQLLDHLFDKF